MRIFLFIYVFVVVATVVILGLPNSKSTKPPLQIFPDMEDQPRFRPQGETGFFENKMMDRPVVPGAVSRGRERADVFTGEYRGKFAYSNAYNRGQLADGSWLVGFPEEMEINYQTLSRGREIYSIFCTNCHGATGTGNGIVTQYGMVGVPNFHTERFLEMPEGEIFDTISHGKGIMAAYGDKIQVHDRWAVITYVRALQRAFNGSVEDVPAEQRTRLGL